jgi:hypothetical protein
MNSGAPKERKEPSKEARLPRVEPEIIPPDRNSMPGNGTARFSMRGGQRVYVWRPSLFAGVLALLLVASALVIAVVVIVGLAAILLPAIAALAVVLVVGRMLRNRYARGR